MLLAPLPTVHPSPDSGHRASLPPRPLDLPLFPCLALPLLPSHRLSLPLITSLPLSPSFYLLLSHRLSLPLITSLSLSPPFYLLPSHRLSLPLITSLPLSPSFYLLPSHRLSLPLITSLSLSLSLLLSPSISLPHIASHCLSLPSPPTLPLLPFASSSPPRYPIQIERERPLMHNTPSAHGNYPNRTQISPKPKSPRPPSPHYIPVKIYYLRVHKTLSRSPSVGPYQRSVQDGLEVFCFVFVCIC